MEERLLILGILRSHEMHGYQLHEFLAERAVTAVHLSKANAYKLLRNLAEEGLVTFTEERHGNRPTRRVYQVTPEGEAAFQALLRRLLTAYVEPEFPSIVPMNFLDELPPEELQTLLQQRREQICTQIVAIEQISEEERLAHLSIDFFLQVYRTELDWLDRVIAQRNL